LNSENLKDGSLKRNSSDITKDGELGDGEEPIKDIMLEFVEDSYGGEDAKIIIEEDIIITDTITGQELGNISMLLIENLNKFIFLVILINFKKLNY